MLRYERFRKRLEQAGFRVIADEAEEIEVDCSEPGYPPGHCHYMISHGDE